MSDLYQGVFIVNCLVFSNDFTLYEIPDVRRLIAVGRCLTIEGLI